MHLIYNNICLSNQNLVTMRTLIIFCLSIFYLFSLDARENYEQNGNNGQIVAIPSSNDSIDAEVDNQFSRTSFFCLYNPVKDTLVFIKNHYQDASGGASRQVVGFLSRNRVTGIYAVKVGDNAVRHLNRQNISVHKVESGQTVKQVIESIEKSEND